MYVKTITGQVIQELREKGLFDAYSPPTIESENYKFWFASIGPTTCLECRKLYGQIYYKNEIVIPEPPLHPNCHCKIRPAVVAGNATKDGENGADWWIKNHGYLPEYYISIDELRAAGWKSGKSPSKYAPGKMLANGRYFDYDGHLPQLPGRIWYEADINYYNGKRNSHRIVWSNDGLIFVTYDHYETFYEIV